MMDKAKLRIIQPSLAGVWAELSKSLCSWETVDCKKWAAWMFLKDGVKGNWRRF